MVLPQGLMPQLPSEDSSSRGSKPRTASELRIRTGSRAQKGKRKESGPKRCFGVLFSHSWDFWQFPQQLGWQWLSGGNARCQSPEWGVIYSQSCRPETGEVAAGQGGESPAKGTGLPACPLTSHPTTSSRGATSLPRSPRPPLDSRLP